MMDDPKKTVKEILDEPDCGCKHPEALHEVDPVLANPRVNIRNGACRVAGCGCLYFDPNRAGPRIETLKERMERQGKGRGSAVIERMKQVGNRFVK